MATKKARPEIPRLRGTPGKLSGSLQLDQAPTLAPVADLPEIAVDPAWVAFDRPVESAVVHVKVGLPDTTPPGSYLAAVPIDGDTYPVVVDVEPRVRLRISPRHLTVRAHAGEKIHAELTLRNLGNVAAVIPRTMAMGLFDSSGLDRAIGRAFRPELPKGERRVDVLAEELAREHGGLLTIRLKGPEEIGPGETARIDMELHVPARAEPDHAYFGYVRLHEERYSIHVDVVDGTGEASFATSMKKERQ